MMISRTAIQLDRHAHPPPSRSAPRPPTVDRLLKIGHRANFFQPLEQQLDDCIGHARADVNDH
jgi:hypothetical protein